MMSGIYTITNKIDGKLYVGWAVDFDRRFKSHRTKLNAQQHKNLHLQGAWNLYGEDNFEIEILEECPEDQLNCMEHYWATLLQVHDKRYGYNIRPTHPYGFPRHSEETRRKIGDKNFMKGKTHTEEFKQRRREHKHSEEVRSRITNFLNSDQNPRRVPIVAYNKDASLYKEFRSAADAAREFGGKASVISNAMRGSYRAFGKFWIYKRDLENIENLKKLWSRPKKTLYESKGS